MRESIGTSRARRNAPCTTQQGSCAAGYGTRDSLRPEADGASPAAPHHVSRSRVHLPLDSSRTGEAWSPSRYSPAREVTK
jgi:hypothetical protein